MPQAPEAGRATGMTAVNSSGFPAPAGMYAVPVVLAPLSGRLHVLLVQRAEMPFAGTWVLPGGFMSPSERPEETAQRKLTEKTGVGTVYLEQLATYGDPDRDPRGWIPSIAYLALIDAAVLNASDAAARWWPVDELPAVVFDHGRTVADGVERLRGKLWYSNIAVGLLPERFTMTQARRLYEEISGVRYEASNFRRELERSGLVRSTGEVVKGVPGRPAALYEFVERSPAWSIRRSRTPAMAGGAQRVTRPPESGAPSRGR
jgi:8-oxo-dGTP diphosphatase